jgi:hypothetical protein
MQTEFGLLYVRGKWSEALNLATAYRKNLVELFIFGVFLDHTKLVLFQMEQLK